MKDSRPDSGQGPGRQQGQALDHIFKARSLALAGASADPDKFGFMTLDTIIKGGYRGEIYPVNPKGGEILGQKVYTSLSELPRVPDLVAVVVPAKFVAAVLDEAGRMGVKGGMVMSGGFREAGRQDLEDELLAVAQKHGMRIIGPNVQGFNYLPNKLCAMFFPVIKTAGPLGVISQSGSVTSALSEWADQEGLGLSAAINLGNQTDLCESDYLEYLAADPTTGSIAMYMEGPKDGRHFLETLGRVTSLKPVVILKGGRSAAGKRSAASHTGALGGEYAVFNAACRQYGAVMANDLEHLYDAAKALASVPRLEGKRIFMVSTSGGGGTLGADESDAQGLGLPGLLKGFAEDSAGLNLSPLVHAANPFDLAGIAVEPFAQVLKMAEQHNQADIFLVCFGDPVTGGSRMLIELKRQLCTPLAVAYFGGGEEERRGRVELNRAGIAAFATPERAMRGLGALWQYAQRREPERLAHPEPAASKAGKRSMFPKGYQYLSEPAAVGKLATYGIPYPDHGVAGNVEEALLLAEGLGYPVVLKVVSSQVIHKSDVGGVAVGLEDAAAVKHEYNAMLARVKLAVPDLSDAKVMVCSRAPSGLEVIVGGLRDPIFGPTVMFGLGGVLTELLKDVAFRVAPFSAAQAMDMIAETRGCALLDGYRNQNAVDKQALVNLIQAVGNMMVENEKIEEMDLNPVRVYAGGVLALDVRIKERCLV